MASTIILSDNGASSGSAGLKSTAGNDGVLILQTTTSGGTATNAVYVDNKQNVGIGGVTPGAWDSSYQSLEIKSAGNAMWSSAANNIRLSSNVVHNGTNYIVQTTGGTAMYSQGAGSHTFYSSSGTGGVALSSWTAVAQVEKDKTFVLQSGTSSSGTGIAFPATQSASTDANTLDDYEEGTWTPTLDVESGTNPTYTVTKAYYTKVGRLVHLYAQFSITSAGSGLLRMSFPFVPTDTTNGCDNYGTAKANFAAGTYQVLGASQYNASRCLFVQTGSSSYWVNANLLAAGGAGFAVNLTYETTT